MKDFLIRNAWIRSVCEIGGFIGWGTTAAYPVHQLWQVTVVGIITYLLFNVLRVFIDRSKEKPTQDPKENALRHLLRLVICQLFGDKAGYRATILLPDLQAQFIRPAYRYQLGGPSGTCNSSAMFQKDIALAGFAWETTQTPFKSQNIGPFATEKEFADHYSREFRLSREQINGLSNHMRKVQSILCFGLVDHRGDFQAVLSIDSIEPQPFDGITEEGLRNLAAAISATLTQS